AWDLTWWYAAPVSGLGFHDNSVDFRIDPGPAVDAPPVITWSPDLGLITFENRARTVAAESTSTIGDNFFRTGGGWNLRAEGTVALGRKTRVESVALPDPNLYAARALAASLARRGVAVEGGAAGTTESAIASMAVKVESHTPGASVSTAKQRADHVGSPRPYRIRSPCSTPASTRPFTY